jgi:membrane protein
LQTFPGDIGRRSNELNLARECLALAAQQTLCTVPLIVAIASITQRFNLESIGQSLSGYLGLSRPASHDVRALFISHGHVSIGDLVVGFVLAVGFATSVAATQQRAYEAIWYQSRVGLRATWRQLVWVVGLTAYLALVLYAGRVGRGVGGRVPSAGLDAVKLLAEFAVSYLFYWWTQRLLLCGRIRWRHLAPGAFASAVGTTVLVGLSPLMSSQITDQVTDYGLIGATFVLSVWLVTLSVIVFGGALVGSVWAERRLRATLQLPAVDDEVAAHAAETAPPPR